jgi:CRISPR system Cascade subunit CasD
MESYFTMRLVAPVATIRGPLVGDGRMPYQPIPSSSMLVGMIGAALGIERRQHSELQRLQDGIEVAWLVHRVPRNIVDYQTTALSRRHMAGPMWAHDGEGAWTERRTGGDASRTLVSERDLTCDVDLTAVVCWHIADPNAEMVLAALDIPAMPLSVGARWALPTQPVAGTIIDASSLEAAVEQVRTRSPAILCYVPIGHIAPAGMPVVAITASRDWRSRRHTGSILYRLEE